MKETHLRCDDCKKEIANNTHYYEISFVKRRHWVEAPKPIPGGIFIGDSISCHLPEKLKDICQACFEKYK